MSSIITNLSLKGIKEGKLSYSTIEFKQGKSTLEADPDGKFELLKRLKEAIENLPKFFEVTPKNDNPQKQTEEKKAKAIVVDEEEAKPSSGMKIEVLEADEEDEDAVPF